MRFGDFQYEPDQRRLTKAGEPVDLSGRYLDALGLLGDHPVHLLDLAEVEVLVLLCVEGVHRHGELTVLEHALLFQFVLLFGQHLCLNFAA